MRNNRTTNRWGSRFAAIQRCFRAWSMLFGLLSLGGLSLGGNLYAQSPADSATLAEARWESWKPAEGLVFRSLRIELFDTPQHLYCLEIDTASYGLGIVQKPHRRTVGALGRTSGSIAAINGGFFITRTCKAIASGIVRIDGETKPSVESKNRAAIGIRSHGRPVFLLNAPEVSDTLSTADYSDLLAAGPMLRFQGETLSKGDSIRHPRSAIGIRKDGTLVWIVVDGRRKKAAGVTLDELGFLARMLGLESALNLDGGGSSALWIKGKGNQNQPSDRIGFIRFPRRVANALIIQAK